MKKLYSLFFASLYAVQAMAYDPAPLDLSPAKWIWYPSERTLQNTFVLFRKEFELDKAPDNAKGWILADSRYQLYVNGRRVQWGPAPSDPRWQEADPLDLTPYLREGKNVIACQVLFFGTGDGTWAMGKPGLLFSLDVDGREIRSDSSWSCMQPASWPRGRYKRWFLRALQEEFDARKHPYGWETPDYTPGTEWLRAQEVSKTGKLSSICNRSSEYVYEIFGDPNHSQIRRRNVPMLEEYEMPVWKLTESMLIKWLRPAEDYFDMIVPDAFEVTRSGILQPTEDNVYVLQPQEDGTATSLIFEFREQGVGWPHFTIDAPEGTVVEMLVHEGHKPGTSPIMNTHYHSWSRFICREGRNRFEPFDFESLRWLQLHIRNFDRPVILSEIGLRRRMYPWKDTPRIVISDDTIQKVMRAAVNTLYNSANETIVDGMARERQQYSGDGGHQLHPLFQLFGEERLPSRYINTFSQGSTLAGYFMDSWPGWDRLARIMEREMQLTEWGPIIDHGIGFGFDCWNYYLYSGNKEALAEVYPRLLRSFDYTAALTAPGEHLLPVENPGVCSVWIDHLAYKKQRHKQLALNLYFAAMCRNALAPLCRLFDDEENALRAERQADELEKACVEKFWDPVEKVFVANLPWAAQEKERRYCDRSLATSVLYGQCPGGETARALEILAARPAEMGFSYPCNAPWRMWALAESGFMDINIAELRSLWGNMRSVWENNTLGEFFDLEYDNSSQWSHCPVTPLIMLHQGIAGIKPLEPGATKCRIRPQPGMLEYAKFDVWTTKGPIGFETSGRAGRRRITLTMPEGCTGELWLDPREKVSLPAAGTTGNGLAKYRIEPGTTVRLSLKYT